MRNQGSITRRQAQDILGVGQSRTLKILKKMTAEKLILQVGKGKNVEYHLNKVK
ncbi:hypothetical protein [Clostridium autoethanogenum]|uniref:hypothetical protein n=1 Tax=Clostridium autoethanogenum TaxID=84023 RepID=UPI001604AC06|nr:hypothetical protein [Clostridium autoethanogenum]